MASDSDDNIGIDWRGVSPAGPTKVSKTLEIKIALPTLPNIPVYTKAKDRLLLLPRKTLLIGGVVAIVAITGAGGYYVVNNQPKVAGVTTQTLGPTKGTPEFKTLLPSSKTAESMGGWTRISPPDRNAVFAYTDKIGNTPINVSQQPLPDNFRTDTAVQVEQLAQSFSAGEKITVGETTVYIGTSSKGPQSIIFGKDELLILIKSDGPIPNNEWAKYIDSLR